MKDTVLITGGARGIGNTVRTKFLKEGYNVLSPTRDELDLNSISSIGNYLNKLEQPVDFLVNNAGVNFIEQISDLNIDSLMKTFQINCFAPFLISKYCIERFFLPRGRGSIINIGSIWLSRIKSGRAAYAMSKSALDALTRSIAVEFGKNNIRCNTISPGFVATELTYTNNNSKDIEEIIRRVPLNRLGHSEEVADLVYYIAVKNQFINGENIYLDGGFTKNY